MAIAPLFDHTGCQRDISGDYQIVFLNHRNDFVIGNVGSVGNRNDFD
jgi:hypothetical protein